MSIPIPASHLETDLDDLDEMDLEDYLDEVRQGLALSTAAAVLFEIPTIEIEAPPERVDDDDEVPADIDSFYLA